MLRCLIQKPNTWWSRTLLGKFVFGGVVQILQSLDATEAVSITFHEKDDQGAITMLENPLSLPRSKHVNVGYHGIRENCAVLANMHQVPPEDQHGDMWTKPLRLGVLLKMME